MMSSMSPEMMQSMMAMAGGSAAGAAPTAGNAATASQQPAPGTNTSPMPNWHAWTLCTGAYVWVDERCNAALPPFSMLNCPLSTLYNRLSCLMLQTQLCQALHALRYRFNPRRLCWLLHTSKYLLCMAGLRLNHVSIHWCVSAGHMPAGGPQISPQMMDQMQKHLSDPATADLITAFTQSMKPEDLAGMLKQGGMDVTTEQVSYPLAGSCAEQELIFSKDTANGADISAYVHFVLGTAYELYCVCCSWFTGLSNAWLIPLSSVHHHA